MKYKGFEIEKGSIAWTVKLNGKILVYLGTQKACKDFINEKIKK